MIAADISADAVVVGGGLVGLSMAIACAGAGLDVVVLDREDPRAMVDAGFDGRASAIAYGSQQVLAAIGLWAEVAEEAEPILEIRVADGEAPVFLHYDHRDIGAAPPGWIVENRTLRRGLLALVAARP